MPPRVLLTALARSGINLIFEDSDSEYADHPTKIPALEQRAYTDMALVSSVCTITSSKWNHDKENGASRAVFKVSKKLCDPEAAVEDLLESEVNMDFIRNNLRMNFKSDDKWDLMTYEQERCCFVDCTDSSESFNPSPQTELQTHLNIFTALQHKYPQTKVEHIVESSDMLLSDTMKILLLITKPLSW
jgi:hypothetical protein